MTNLSSLILRCALSVAALVAPAADATTFQALHTFTGGADGGLPYAGLAFGAAKSALYGTASSGGANGLGAVFKFNLATRTLTTLYSFTTGSDAKAPSAGLTIDKAGILYGTTTADVSPYAGTVFKLDSTTGMLAILHAFSGGADGGQPNGGLVFDNNGLLYGTTSLAGGSDPFNDKGTVFRLDPSTKVLSTLHVFVGADGGYPFAGLLTHGSSTYYGTTNSTIFALYPATQKLTVLYTFNNPVDGGNPRAPLLSDKSGTLYGTAINGGRGACPSVYTQYCGTLFKFIPATRELTLLHSFTGVDGAQPLSPLVADKNGVLYGTTSVGGASCPGISSQGCGTVFRFDPVTKRLTTLHAFTGGADGAYLYSGLAIDGSGALYGTTEGGGAKGFGTIFKITP
jgi:uncharacterized repeat protein (TIGR03803 family)